MSNFNFMDLAKAEYVRRLGQAMVTGQKIQSDRGPAKAKPVPQMSSEEKVRRKAAKAERGRQKDAENAKRGQLVMGAVGNFAKAVAAGLEKEGARRSSRGLSGAGFAAAFSSGIEGLTDYTDMLQGNAAPGEVLFDAAMKSAEDKNKKLEDKGVDSEDKAYEVDEVDGVDEQEGKFPDLLARPVETEEADIVPNTIRQAVQEGIERGAEITGPPRPVLIDNPGYSFNMMKALKKYSPQVLEQSKPVIEQKAMPEVRQATGQGDTAYTSAPGLAGGSFTEGSYTAGGQPIQAK